MIISAIFTSAPKRWSSLPILKQTGVCQTVAMKRTPDKNLKNVVKGLATDGVNAHNAQQLQQDANDRKHQDDMNHDHNPLH
ncbi:MAG: hypothetical protein K0R57_4806 [Paenibacillaceae bacterium]|nr:hypothetical protein [Paenibacillaceae bacterium]